MAGEAFVKLSAENSWRQAFQKLSFPELKTPVFVISESDLLNNAAIIKELQEKAGCKILMALKCFAMPRALKALRPFFSGTCASGLFEAKMGYENFGAETHVYAPAFSEADMQELVKIADHIVFNSFSQLDLHKKIIKESGRKISLGLRVNPGYSEVETAIYNPCSPHSRFGITPELLALRGVKEVSGLHFHTMCEQKVEVLERTLTVFSKKFGSFLKDLDWVNFGGGQLMTSLDYDRKLFVKLISEFKTAYQLKDIYLEPGEAISKDAGILVASVLDITENGMPIAILDTSAANHMPDVLEMPYRPEILGAGLPGEKPFTYRLGAPSCLAGDYIGDYSFDEPLKVGSRLVFLDMAIYSFVKTCMFNGINLPALAYCDKNGRTEVVRTFGYDDYASRLGKL